ncbi:hypothetical protein [Paenibacillus guangzhouensis]|uniref:hypothetical protein n=1 Tax=Paenibacillus guangzhouensis TaxID=1473112 RepID=UPI0012669D9E|nr:hypothetical protein [Paenibacillus guangzhouensis]
MKYVNALLVTLICAGILFLDLPTIYRSQSKKDRIVYLVILGIGLILCYLSIFDAPIPSPYLVLGWVFSPMGTAIYNYLTGDTY